MSFASECPQSPDFAALGLNTRLLASLATAGYTAPTAIQSQAVPALLKGQDVLGQAATGTGKTAAFGLPVLQLLMENPSRTGPSALILVPTRELAMQVANSLNTYSRGAVRVVPVYGGQPMGLQLRALKAGADVVVATPGRLLDHLNRRSVRLDAIKMVVLDEADEMLDMGFAEDLDAIFAMVPEERQTALFSATLPQRIASIAARHLKDPVRIQVRAEKPGKGGVERIQQHAYIVLHRHKAAALARILGMEEPVATMVFCRTREDVDELASFMNRDREQCLALHGGMSQPIRDRVMQRFRKSEVDTLVATDVAARGLDIDHISHVVNFDMPSNAEVYTHRIGRTGRAGRNGVAISLVKPNEQRLLSEVERRTGSKVVVGKLPSGAEMRSKRLEQSVLAVTEVLKSADMKSMARFALPLAEEFSPEELAAAALWLAQGDRGPQDDQDIPCMSASPQSAGSRRPPPNRFKRRQGGGDGQTSRPAARRPSGGRATGAPASQSGPSSSGEGGYQRSFGGKPSAGKLGGGKKKPRR